MNGYLILGSIGVLALLVIMVMRSVERFRSQSTPLQPTFSKLSKCQFLPKLAGKYCVHALSKRHR